MLEVKGRDVRKKGKVLRNNGIITGTLKKKNGDIDNIQTIGNTLDTIVSRNGLTLPLQIKYDGKVISAKIYRVQRHNLMHNIINIDLIEL